MFLFTEMQNMLKYQTIVSKYSGLPDKSNRNGGQWTCNTWENEWQYYWYLQGSTILRLFIIKRDTVHWNVINVDNSTIHNRHAPQKVSSNYKEGWRQAGRIPLKCHSRDNGKGAMIHTWLWPTAKGQKGTTANVRWSILGCGQLRGKLSERSKQAKMRVHVQAGDDPMAANFNIFSLLMQYLCLCFGSIWRQPKGGNVEALETGHTF